MSGAENPIYRAVDRFFQFVDKFNFWTGRIISYLALVMMLTIMYEVVSRYFFNAPTLWCTELNIYLLCAYVLLSGGAIMLAGGHVRVDLLWASLSKKRQATADIFTSVLIFAFCIALVWKGSELAFRSLADNRLSAEAMAWPLFPSQMTVPIGGFLLGMQSLAKLWRDIAALRGRAA